MYQPNFGVFVLGFVHLKMDLVNLLVPVTISVQRGGLQIQPPIIDFGTLINSEMSQQMPVSVTNNGENAVKIESFSLRNGQEGLLYKQMKRFPFVINPKDTITYFIIFTKHLKTKL